MKNVFPVEFPRMVAYMHSTVEYADIIAWNL